MTDQAFEDSWIEEVAAFAVKEKNPSLKEIYALARGKEVSLDFFLYTCFEEDQTCKALQTAAAKDRHYSKRWDLLTAHYENADYREAAELATCSPILAAESLEELVAKLCQWYSQHYPLLCGTQTLDYDVHMEFVHGFVLLTRDLATLLQLKLGKNLAAKETPELSIEEQEAWIAVEKNFKKAFPSYSHLMLAYWEWSYRKSPPPAYDLASLPPVGRYAAIIQKAFYKKREREKPLLATGRQAPPRRDQRPSEEEQQALRAREAAAMQEAVEAVEKLKASPQIKNIILNPQNSFLRRLQHRHIVEQGFNSLSTGEGEERAVMISRE